ncbi:hypothetical protein Nepgr_029231 [Nepenthes gracilis]|uniref:Myb-like domain-containing protein n=1 Tax=Nepenthes gracilis TaxID=150966 RepID=A0AAD3Y335_NEPGR|nr:hypothetical protein Nepgr_029231 [Nepenthes gracilis]
MALERLSLPSGSGPVDHNRDAVSNSGIDGRVELGDEGSKALRLPRWTRQEILVLIQGKMVAENRVRRGRTAGLSFGSGNPEPKWASVSSYCTRHGVNRGPVQCRKRWSNLAGDFKKIKEWESQIKEESESFWVMRNDLRRERRLPGFFDKEVYDILNAASISVTAPRLALALAPALESAERDGKGVGEQVVAVADAAFDGGRSAVVCHGLLSDFEQSGDQEMGRSPNHVGVPLLLKELSVSTALHAPVPESEKPYQPFTSEGVASHGANKKQPPLNIGIGLTSQEGRKRKLNATEEGDETTSLEDQLIQVLDRNGRVLSAQLEAQNNNTNLDREERNDHANGLVAVLNKLADALGRIADKL